VTSDWCVQYTGLMRLERLGTGIVGDRTRVYVGFVIMATISLPTCLSCNLFRDRDRPTRVRSMMVPVRSRRWRVHRPMGRYCPGERPVARRRAMALGGGWLVARGQSVRTRKRRSRRSNERTVPSGQNSRCVQRVSSLRSTIGGRGQRRPTVTRTNRPPSGL